VFFTGDAAFGHVGNGPGESLADQFQDAAGFLKGVRQAFSPAVRAEDVFLVPGNHDIHRGEVTEDQTEWLDQQTSAEPITRLIQQGNKQWQRYMDRLGAYRQFLTDSGYGHVLDDPTRLIYSAVRELAGLRVGIAGLNSAWSCCRDREKGKLWLAGNWQLGHLNSRLDDTDLAIALIHHPINWFVEYEDPDLWRAIELEFAFCLHGHEHQGWVDAKADGHTRIAAAACYDRSDLPNGYNFVRLNLDSGECEIWLRQYDRSGGGWVPRIIKRRTDRDGCWRLRHLETLRRKAVQGQWLLTIRARFEDIDKARAEQIVEEIRRISGYQHLTLDLVQAGSVQLILHSSEAAFQRVEELVRTGELSEQLHLTVEGIRWLGRADHDGPQLTAPGEIAQEPAARPRDLIYISYSHRDRGWLDRLLRELQPRCKKLGVPIWSDLRLTPADDWRREMDIAQSRAKVAVFLVSPSSLSSKSIADTELYQLTGAANEELLRLLWVPLSDCDWRDSPLARFVAAHPPEHPLDTLSSKDLRQALRSISEAILDHATRPAESPRQTVPNLKITRGPGAVNIGGVRLPVRENDPAETTRVPMQREGISGQPAAAPPAPLTARILGPDTLKVGERGIYRADFEGDLRFEWQYTQPAKLTDRNVFIELGYPRQTETLTLVVYAPDGQRITTSKTIKATPAQEPSIIAPHAPRPETPMKDFFISYNRHDRQWAEWIAWTLEEAGLTTVIQAWDFRPGGDFVMEMHKAAKGTRKTLAVLSDNYLGAEYTQPEWGNAFARDPQGHERTLIPVRVAPCKPEGLLATRIYADLVGLSMDEARQRLLGAIQDRGKPTSAPVFPGAVSSPPAASPPDSGTSPAAPVSGTMARHDFPGHASKAIGVWREKLEFLLAHEPLATSPDQKFALKKQIEEAEQRIRELGGFEQRAP
jgi:hypothetical protein